MAIFSVAEMSGYVTKGKTVKVPKSSCKKNFKNLKVTRLLGMISGMPKLTKFQT